jgi:peptidoglycan/LPS O-acetylase OafA/YrhL
MMGPFVLTLAFLSAVSVFPFVAPWMQHKSQTTYKLWIVGLYVLQLISWVLYASLFTNDFDSGYWHARAAPLSRIPVFLMGCAGGFLRLQEGNNVHSDGITTDIAFCAYLVVILAAGLVSSGFGYDLNLTASLEALCPPMQLAVILDLTRDAGQSRTAQFCKTRVMTTLGEISMSFYMSHYSIMMYIALLHDWDPLPWYAVPYSLSISLIIGYGATHNFEKPADKWLRMP